MKLQFKRLLSQIDPNRTYGQTQKRVDHAFNLFPMKPHLVKNMKIFKQVGASYFCHIENHVLRLSPPRKPDLNFDWSRFQDQLVKIYGPNGEKTALELILSGCEGGMKGVFASVGDTMANKYAQNEINARVGYFWDQISDQEKFEVMDLFILRLKKLFPNELRNNGTIRIKANFIKYLTEYPLMLKRAREMARNF